MDERQKLSTESYKGVRDFYPEDQAVQKYLFITMQQVAESFGYAEYSASILEPAELYKGKGAENEELVNEQTYTFTDRGNREVTLRPEMTPTVARMVAAKRKELGFPLRLFSIPNVFRYERPQRGRLREHWQLNVDIFGAPSPYAEVEIISVAHAVMKAFGATDDDFVIKLSSRAALDAAFTAHNLSEDERKAVRTLIDRKAKMPTEEFEAKMQEAAPGFSLPSSEPQDVSLVRRHLADLGITNTEYDASVVRGFDYYTGIVFEVYDNDPANNRALFGGGRYDNLLELFSDDKVSGIGFGMGDVTMRDFLETRGRLPEFLSPAKLYIATTSPDMIPFALTLANDLRAKTINVEVNLSEKKLADQIKVADKHKVPFLLVVGSNEVESGEFTIRDLKTGHETPLTRDALASFFM